MKTQATPYSHLKIFHHSEILNQMKDGKRVAPIYIRIKPTNVCNENCYYCHYKNSYLNLDEYNPSDYIPREKMLEIVSDMGGMGVKAVTFSGGGEPLVYPYIAETMQAVLDEGIDLSIITNGILLKDRNAEILKNANWVRLSIDSCKAEKYAGFRGVPEEWFFVLCDNISKFSAIKAANCELGVNFVVNKDNYEDVYEMAVLMKSLGVNHVKYAPVINNQTEAYHEPFQENVMSQLAKARSLEDKNFRIIDLYTDDIQRIKNGTMIFDRAYEKCYMKEIICIIAANQKVYFCQDKAYLSNGCVGDLREARFKDVWFSDETDKKFADFNAKCVCNEHCVHDSRNILLNQFFSINKQHINFL